MWVRFIKDCDFIPPEDRRIGIAYKEGMRLNVKKAWALNMRDSGHCVTISTPRRGELPKD